VRFEQIHPFQDGNGRVGRLILLKECLKYGITPFVIAENFKQFYYLGLQDWRRGSRLRLLDSGNRGRPRGADVRVRRRARCGPRRVPR